MEQQAYDNFIIRLQNEFTDRARKNPNYSIRAFAQYLDVDQSLLSKIFRKKRKPSIQFISSVSERLGLTSEQFGPKITDLKNMSEDAFQCISDWSHFAILELVKCDGSEISVSEIARRLVISKPQAEAALERLERLGFILRSSSGIELLRSNNTWMDATNTTAARRNLQIDLFQRALHALEHVDFSRRDHSSLTVACDEELLPKVREKIKKFRWELDAYIQNHGNENQVYQLVVGFFPLTNKLSHGMAKEGDKK